MVTCLWMFRVFFSFLCVPPVRVRLFTADDYLFFFSSRRLHTRSLCDWSSDVCSSDLDLVEPAPQAHARVTHDGAAALPSTQPTVWLPLELDRIRTAVTLDRTTVVGAECFSDGRPDVLVVVADQEPAHPLKALNQVGWQCVEDVWRVGHRGLASARRRNEARNQHEPRGVERIAKFVVHAYMLVGLPL